jgi:hypothetical protein
MILDQRTQDSGVEHPPHDETLDIILGNIM